MGVFPVESGGEVVKLVLFLSWERVADSLRNDRVAGVMWGKREREMDWSMHLLGAGGWGVEGISGYIRKMSVSRMLYKSTMEQNKI